MGYSTTVAKTHQISLLAQMGSASQAGSANVGDNVLKLIFSLDAIEKSTLACAVAALHPRAHRERRHRRPLLAHGHAHEKVCKTCIHGRS